jgi:hypothetical protein
MSALDKAVTKDGDFWDFACPGVIGDFCGEPAADAPNFTSTGWPTKAAATARGQQHFDQHKSGAPMQELHDFRVDQGLVVGDDGRVSVGDL